MSPIFLLTIPLCLGEMIAQQGSMCLAAFEMGRVSAFFLESRIALGKKRADSAFFPTS
jgi:hypothetical protein